MMSMIASMLGVQAKLFVLGHAQQRAEAANSGLEAAMARGERTSAGST